MDIFEQLLIKSLPFIIFVVVALSSCIDIIKGIKNSKKKDDDLLN
jgi:hypothetical protein